MPPPNEATCRKPPAATRRPVGIRILCLALVQIVDSASCTRAAHEGTEGRGRNERPSDDARARTKLASFAA